MFLDANAAATHPYGLDSVSCPSTSLCVAVDFFGDVLTSTDPGGGSSAWRAGQARIITGAGLVGVSCPSSSLCVAVGGGSVASSTDPAGGSATWKASALSGGGGLSAVSCPSVSLCVAVGDEGTVATSTYPAGGAGAWKVIQAPTSTPEECDKYGPGEDCHAGFTAVSCPSASLCVAVDNADGSLGDAVTSSDPAGGAAAWHATPIDNQAFLIGVSCPTVFLCVAADSYLNALASAHPTGNAASWVTYPSGGQITAVSCGSTSLCVQTLDMCCNLPGPPPSAGIVATSVDPLDGPTSWTTSEIAPSAKSGLRAVSCVSSRMCVTVGDGIVVVGILPTRGQIETILRAQIMPPLRERRIVTLLRRGSERVALRAIGAGRLRISWSADRAHTHTQDKVLVATARATFDRTRTLAVTLKLTPAGRRLLGHRIHLDVTAKESFTPIGRAPVVAIKRFVLV